MLDGISSGSFLRSDAAGTATGRITSTAGTGNSAMGVTTANLGAFEARGNGTGAAMMGFHRPGTFASYFGIDTDNVWKVGGWSMGASASRVILGDGYANGGDVSFNGTINGARIYAGWDSTSPGSISCNAWFRTLGATGIFFQSYNGGVFMQNSTYVEIYGSKKLLVNNAIDATGNITAYYSDMRLKTKVGTLDNALDKVNQLEGFLYVENDLAKSVGYDNPDVQVGLSAQKVKEICPQIVSLAPFDKEVSEFGGEVSSKSGENYLTVDYAKLVPLLVESIKELSAKNEELSHRIKKLEGV